MLLNCFVRSCVGAYVSVRLRDNFAAISAIKKKVKKIKCTQRTRVHIYYVVGNGDVACDLT